MMSFKGQIQRGYQDMEGASMFLKLLTAAQAPEKFSSLCFQVPFSVILDSSYMLVSKQRQPQKKGWDHISAITVTYMHCLSLKEHTSLPSPPSEGL